MRIVPCVINGDKHNYACFLIDGIYPSWFIFEKIIADLGNEIDLKYTKRYECVRKYIEQYFGMMVIRFRILER